MIRVTNGAAHHLGLRAHAFWKLAVFRFLLVLSCHACFQPEPLFKKEFGLRVSRLCNTRVYKYKYKTKPYTLLAGKTTVRY